MTATWMLWCGVQRLPESQQQLTLATLCTISAARDFASRSERQLTCLELHRAVRNDRAQPLQTWIGFAQPVSLQHIDER